jgi:hypothetical protein
MRVSKTVVRLLCAMIGLHMLIDTAAVRAEDTDQLSGDEISNVPQWRKNLTFGMSRVGFEDWYTPKYYGEPGSGNEVVFRAFPTLAIGSFDTSGRLTVPFLTSTLAKGGDGSDSSDQTETASGPTGLGDIEFYDLLVLKTKRGPVTIGPTFSFPTARNASNGSSKWEVGPAGGFTLSPRNWRVGFFTQSFFSFAGEASAKSVAKTQLQPIFTRSIIHGWTIGSSTMNFTYNWESHHWTNVPIGIKIGKLISIGTQSIDTSLEGEYNLYNKDGTAAWTVRLKLYYVFPKS